MDKWINYHHLYYFMVIAEESSVSKAAARLRLGQPTLSAQLKQFEDHLGVQLFERQHKKLILTEQGKVAFDYAKGIFRLGAEMYEVLHDRLLPAKTHLHLGALDGVPKQLVLKLATKALKSTSCQLTLSEGNLDELLIELTSHRMDLVVTNFLPNGIDNKTITARKISREGIHLFASPEFKKLKKDFPASISEVPMILPTYDSRLRQDIENWAKIHRVTLNVLVETQDVAVKTMIAVQGLGVVPASKMSVAENLKNGDLVEIGVLPGLYEELYLLSAQRRIENQLATKLRDMF